MKLLLILMAISTLGMSDCDAKRHAKADKNSYILMEKLQKKGLLVYLYPEQRELLRLEFRDELYNECK